LTTFHLPGAQVAFWIPQVLTNRIRTKGLPFPSLVSIGSKTAAKSRHPCMPRIRRKRCCFSWIFVFHSFSLTKVCFPLAMCWSRWVKSHSQSNRHARLPFQPQIPDGTALWQVLVTPASSHAEFDGAFPPPESGRKRPPFDLFWFLVDACSWTFRVPAMGPGWTRSRGQSDPLNFSLPLGSTNFVPPPPVSPLGFP